MSRSRRFPRLQTANEAGISLVEVLVYLVLASIVLGAVYQLLIDQNRRYTKQQQLISVRGSLRAAAALLSSELRWSSSGSGDLYSVASNSFSVRSIQGAGVLCARHISQPRYALSATWGDFNSTANDSALVFAVGGATAGDDDWRPVALLNILSPGAGGVPSCAWSGSPSPDFVVEVAGDTSSVTIGAPFRAFRRVEYGLYQDGGRWWLGRKIGVGSYERLTGPLLAPADSGLVFTYYDQAGNPTTDATQVTQVKIVLRGEGFGKLRRVGQTSTELQDTLTTRVFLRN